MKFTPIEFNAPKRTSTGNKNGTGVRTKIKLIIPQIVISEIIAGKKDNDIRNTYHLNHSVVTAIEDAIPLHLFDTYLECLVTFRKVRIFYLNGVQIIIQFGKHKRQVTVYQDSDVLIDVFISLLNPALESTEMPLPDTQPKNEV